MDIKVRYNRKRRGRAKIRGTGRCPRAVVYRSNRETGLQLVDDDAGITLLAVTSGTGDKKGSKTDQAAEAGKEMANKAKQKGIKKIVFDRGGYRYHGRVKVLAEALRKGGLEF